MHKFVALMRRYTHAYTNLQNFAACDDIMVPGYTLHMGTYDLSGRDSHYKPATQRQFDQFPGLCLTINEIVTNGDRLCMRFSEHGASVRHNGARAVWSGIGLYKWDGERLLENFVEQDYWGRRLQLVSGRPGAVEAPAIAPWDTEPQPANEENEAVVRSLLESGGLADAPGVAFDDRWHPDSATPATRVIEPGNVAFNDLFSAGDRVAFHITQHGRLLADFSHGRADRVGETVMLHMVGLLRVENGAVVSGRVVRDRIGLYRRLERSDRSSRHG